MLTIFCLIFVCMFRSIRFMPFKLFYAIRRNETCCFFFLNEAGIFLVSIILEAWILRKTWTTTQYPYKTMKFCSTPKTLTRQAAWRDGQCSQELITWLYRASSTSPSQTSLTPEECTCRRRRTVPALGRHSPVRTLQIPPRFSTQGECPRCAARKTLGGEWDLTTNEQRL